MTDGLRRRFCTAAATTSQAGLLSTAMASVSGDRSESPYVLRLIWSFTAASARAAAAARARRRWAFSTPLRGRWWGPR